MGFFNKVTDIVEKGVGIIDQAVEDKDKANELKYDLAKTANINMLTGGGTSITKITICFLVGIVVLVGTYVFLVNPEKMEDFKDYAFAVTPLIGILVGAYGAGTTIQKIIKK